MDTSLTFTKMHGCGNDYIFLNDFSSNTTNSLKFIGDLHSNMKNLADLAIKLSNRNTSIGADGLVFIMPSEIADAKMRMFNADGSEGLMCGNSIRCVGKYLFDNKIVSSLQMSIETLSGIRKLELILEAGSISAARVDMGPAELLPEEIPVNLTGSRVVARKVDILPYEITCLSMGNPHAVIFNDDIAHFDLHTIGPMFEASELFPQGVNLAVVQMISRTKMHMRAWERGTGETMASGTSACAAAVAAVLMGYSDKNVDTQVYVKGGILTVKYTDETVYMTGDCRISYEGVVKI